MSELKEEPDGTFDTATDSTTVGAPTEENHETDSFGAGANAASDNVDRPPEAYYPPAGHNATGPPPPTQPSLPVTQSRLAFIANTQSPGGGPMTGSFIYLSEPSELTSPFSNRSAEASPARNLGHHHHHHNAGQTAWDPSGVPYAEGHMDPFLALLNATMQQPTNIVNNNVENPEVPNTVVSDLTDPTFSTTNKSDKKNKKKKKKNSDPTSSPAPTIGPLQSFRTRRRNRAAKEDQQEEAPQQQQPCHRTTDTQVWNGGDASLNGSAAQAFVFNGVPIVFASSNNMNVNTNTTATAPTSAWDQVRQQLPPPQMHSFRFQPGASPHHRRFDTNMTLVSHDMVSDGATRRSTSDTLPSVHFLNPDVHRRRVQGLGRHIHHVVRDSRSMQIVNNEQIERVKTMHQRFAEGSNFSFNYNTLILTASVLAGLGLASDSSTTVIASMLVSPIMGPVVGMAYGATIHDFRLFKTALQTELLSLIFCIAMGALLAACIGATPLAEEWPTSEMVTRGTWQNFLVALPVAFFSGLGVAVGLLDDQMSSLVGVAISASLLPPAVNSGMLWVSYAFSEKDWWTDFLRPLPAGSVDPEEFEDDIIPEYIHRKEFRKAGLISLSLTLANIFLVAMASMIMFRLKERLPIPSKKIFWEDLGVARKIYRNLAFMENDHDSEVSSEVVDGHSASDSSSSSRTTSNRDNDEEDGNGPSMYGVRQAMHSSIPEGNENESTEL